MNSNTDVYPSSECLIHNLRRHVYCLGPRCENRDTMLHAADRIAGLQAKVQELEADNMKLRYAWFRSTDYATRSISDLPTPPEERVMRKEAPRIPTEGFQPDPNYYESAYDMVEAYELAADGLWEQGE